MTRDEIIRMAREAELLVGDDTTVPYIEGTDIGPMIENFADIVADAEREACAKLCDDKAKETFSGQCQVWGDYFARAIRARSNVQQEPQK